MTQGKQQTRMARNTKHVVKTVLNVGILCMNGELLEFCGRCGLGSSRRKSSLQRKMDSHSVPAEDADWTAAVGGFNSPACMFMSNVLSPTGWIDHRCHIWQWLTAPLIAMLALGGRGKKTMVGPCGRNVQAFTYKSSSGYYIMVQNDHCLPQCLRVILIGSWWCDGMMVPWKKNTSCSHTVCCFHPSTMFKFIYPRNKLSQALCGSDWHVSGTLNTEKCQVLSAGVRCLVNFFLHSTAAILSGGLQSII